MPRLPRTAALALVAVVLAGCRIDGAGAVPDGYHRMPDGTLMANVDPDMGVEYRDITGNGIELPTHTLTDGTIVLGQPGSGHNHPAYDFSFLPQGITPVAVRLPRLDVVAPVVATQMSASAIQGPPVAGDLAWLEQTRRPGEIGPAVIGGVQELDGEPGALAGIDQLRPGDEFIVLGDEGEALGFTVDDVRAVPVGDRSDAVFAMGEGRPELRLVAWWTGPADADDAADWVVDAHQITSDA